MSNEYKFPITLPIDISFFNAESLSPAKLNNIFEYIKSANYSIEMFIGNGIDYNITNDLSRKLIGNITNALGDVAGNIYMPYNLLDTLKALYKDFGSVYANTGSNKYNTNEHIQYNSINDCIIIKDTVNIPINCTFDCDVTIGIQYSTNIKNSSNPNNISCIVYTVDNTIVDDNERLSQVTLLNNATITSANSENVICHRNIIIPSGVFIYYIEFKNLDQNNIKFNIFDLYITKNISDTAEYNSPVLFSIKSALQSLPINNIPLNSFYAIGKDHSSYIVVQRPCKWSDASFNANSYTCSKAVASGACIGNTYDIYVDNGQDIKDKIGIPVCGGTIATTSVLNNVDASLLPTNGTGTQLQYNSTYDGNSSPSFYILQSPLLTYKNKQGALKYHPLALIRSGNIGSLPEGRLNLYDTDVTSGNPVLFSTKFTTTSRPDIIKAFNTNIIPGNYNKYILLGSDIGIGEMNNEMLKVKSEKVLRTVSVYTD
jgi:hypothetical protein